MDFASQTGLIQEREGGGEWETLHSVSSSTMNMSDSALRPVVHLELHTPDQAAASAFYERLLAWRPELIEARCGSYVALELGRGLGGGIVECGTRRPRWLPYVEVEQVDDVTERARQLGARVLLEPREGPAGWRSVVSAPQAGEIAFWHPKR
jgi:predicted enzyme related to lactoylglutathione lyase